MGITFYDGNKKFVFDFEHDGATDIITLTGNGYKVKAFGHCFYYGYEFSDDVPGGVRTEFIKYLKFTGGLKNNPDLTDFIKRAVDALHKKIDLYDYDLVIMPESSSEVNDYTMRYIYRFAQPKLQELQLVKALPENIDFDIKAYSKQYLDTTLENGRPRYTEKQKDDVKKSIQSMLDDIHKKDYFTIAKDVKKSRFRPYITRFLTFKTKEDEELCAQIRKQNVLIIDDVTTSGSTLNEILRTLRFINKDNKITIFSLIGRKDLMADSFV